MWRWALSASKIEGCGLKSDTVYKKVLYADAVIQWLTWETQREIIKVHEIEHQSFLFDKLQAQSCLKKDVNIISFIETERKSQSYWVNSSL